MKQILGFTLLALCLSGCFQLTYGEAGSDAAIPKKLVILHSTDTHSKYLPFWMEPNFFDREMGLQSRFPACWDLDWGGGASYCNGNFIAYDLDGNGRIDPYDIDGDGVIETLDLDGDGVFGEPYDIDGDGELEPSDIDRDGIYGEPYDIDGDGIIEPIYDIDGDGEAGEPWDADGDGEIEPGEIETEIEVEIEIEIEKAYRVYDFGVYVHLDRASVTPGTWMEDPNHDGVCDVKDCQRCWDRNQNNVCDLNEDVDDELGCDIGDCLFQEDNKRVFSCWDLQLPADDEALASYTPVCDPGDDLNNDHLCGYDDCAPVWDRDHDFECDHPWNSVDNTYVDADGDPILRDDFDDDLSYAAVYNPARQNSEDNNRDGRCDYGDYRPGLINTGGVARVATLQNQLKEKHDGVALLRLDSGDASQGAPQYNLYRGELEMVTIQKLGMDAMAVGNHEFDSGAEQLATSYRTAGGFPLMAANYIFDEEDDKGMREIISPYYIFRREQLTIGIVGLGNDSSLTSIYNVSGSLGFNALEPAAVAQRYVDMLRPQVDVMILLTHQGLEGDFELAEEIEGVDIILGGHHHVILDPVKVMHGPDGREVLVVHSGVNYKILAELEVVIANKRVVWHRYSTHPITDSITPDPDMNAVLYPYVQGLIYAQDLNKIVGRATATIKRVDPSGGDSPLGNILTDAMVSHELSRSHFAMTNSLGIRADIPTGDIAYSKLYEVFPFENTIVTMYLSGKEIKELFDYVARRSSTRGCKTQVQVSGMRVEMDCSPPAEDVERYNSYALTRNLSIGETVIVDEYELVQPNMIFKMATNDYVGRGGSGFDMLERNTTRLDTSVSLRDSVAEFFEEEGDIDPMDFTTGGGGEPKRILMEN